MAEPEKTILEAIKDLAPVLAAGAGGLIDYLNQLQRAERTWSLTGFVVHILSAVFFGYLVGSASAALGYPPGISHAVGGLGGFLGTRVADLALLYTNRKK